MRRRQVLAALGTAALGGCAAAGSSGGDDYDVGMTAVAFDPSAVTVSAGETVVWRNTSTRAHSVTAYEDAIPDGADYFASGGFESETAARDGWANGLTGNVTSGDEFTHRFELPGTYEYFCIPHERSGMVGRVVVEA
ncbi:MAG: plastocyanin/azurin family copper-binding protein [Haloferacaceae archaeon]